MDDVDVSGLSVAVVNPEEQSGRSALSDAVCVIVGLDFDPALLRPAVAGPESSGGAKGSAAERLTLHRPTPHFGRFRRTSSARQTTTGLPNVDDMSASSMPRR